MQALQQSQLKWEEELAIHVRKAITADESAPKQKHVRACIIYTWDVQSSGSFWVVLKNQPVLGDEVMTFKALITFHKVVKDGHPHVLRDGITESVWLDSLVRGISHMGNRGTLSSNYQSLSVRIRGDYQIIRTVPPGKVAVSQGPSRFQW